MTTLHHPASNAAQLELDHTLIRMHPGLAGGSLVAHPAICVEIKPKCGLLPAGPPLTEAAPGRCRFCLRVSMKESASGAHSAYCPLDLYSAEPERVHKALGALLDVPHNNLRAFSPQGRLVSTGVAAAKPWLPARRERRVHSASRRVHLARPLG